MNNSLTPSGASARLCMATLCVLVFLGTGLLTPSAQAKYGPDDEAETLEAMQPKKEAEAPLPPYPALTGLLPVDTGPTSRQSFEIDPKSLTIAEEFVVRYVVVATSSSGAKNVSYEGLNCMSMQFKRYAYGTRDGKWVRTREDKWQRISSLSQNQLPYALKQFFFCSNGLVVGTPKDILERIRNNRPLPNN